MTSDRLRWRLGVMPLRSSALRLRVARVICELAPVLGFIAQAESDETSPGEQLDLQLLLDRLVHKFERTTDEMCYFTTSFLTSSTHPRHWSQAERIGSAATQMMLRADDGMAACPVDLVDLACDLAELASCLGLGPLFIGELLAAVEGATARTWGTGGGAPPAPSIAGSI